MGAKALKKLLDEVFTPKHAYVKSKYRYGKNKYAIDLAKFSDDQLDVLYPFIKRAYVTSLGTYYIPFGIIFESEVFMGNSSRDKVYQMHYLMLYYAHKREMMAAYKYLTDEEKLKIELDDE